MIRSFQSGMYVLYAVKQVRYFGYKIINSLKLDFYLKILKKYSTLWLMIFTKIDR